MPLFQGCVTLEQARKRYRELIRQNHPDALNRNAQIINAEWEQLEREAVDGVLPECYHIDTRKERIVEKVVERTITQRVEVPVYIEHVIEVLPERKKYTCVRCGRTSDDRRSFNMHFGGNLTCWNC